MVANPAVEALKALVEACEKADIPDCATVGVYRSFGSSFPTLSDLRAACEHGDHEISELREQVDHWRVKAECYGSMVRGVEPVLKAAGHPVDSDVRSGGAVAGVRHAVEALVLERDALQAARAACEVEEIVVAEGTYNGANGCVYDDEDEWVAGLMNVPPVFMDHRVEVVLRRVGKEKA